MVDNPSFLSTQDPSAYKRTQRCAGNLVFSPSPRIDIGLEYIWGERTHLSGQSGHSSQIQCVGYSRFQEALMRSARLRVWGSATVAAVAFYGIFDLLVVPKIARAQIEGQARVLLHREATVARVRFNPFTLTTVVEGPQAMARIAADGRPSVADLFETRADHKPVGPRSSFPRVFVDHFTVRGGAAKFVDESRSPAFVEAVGPLDLALRGLTPIPDESGHHAITLGLGEGARKRWLGRQTVEPLRFEGKVEITNIRLPHLREYFGATNPLMLRDGKAEVTCSYDLYKGSDASVTMEIRVAGAAVRDLAMRPRSGGDDWLTVPLVEVVVAEVHWPEARAEIKELHIKDPRVSAWLDETRTVNWLSAIPASTAAPAGQSKPWTAKVGGVEISRASAHVEDRSFRPNIAVDLTEVGIKVEDVTSDLESPFPVRLSSRASTAAANLDIALRDLDLKPFNPYAIHFPWADIRRGVASASGKLPVGNGSPAITFDGAFAHLDIDRDGNVNIKKIFAKGDGAPSAPRTPANRSIWPSGRLR